MNYNVEYHDNFKKELKPIAKKYPSLKEDLQFLLDNFGKELALADDLGGGFRKIRLNIKSKRKGKKGGARIISYEILLSTHETNVVLASIYDKSEFESIDIQKLRDALGV
ncbi:toxin [Moheibacter sp.]|uniref:toxin n=1 Tax=Moheibacter sp. TaxID=1965316 RepID=UPI003C711D14